MWLDPALAGSSQTSSAARQLVSLAHATNGCRELGRPLSEARATCGCRHRILTRLHMKRNSASNTPMVADERGEEDRAAGWGEDRGAVQVGAKLTTHCWTLRFRVCCVVTVASFVCCFSCERHRTGGKSCHFGCGRVCAHSKQQTPGRRHRQKGRSRPITEC